MKRTALPLSLLIIDDNASVRAMLEDWCDDTGGPFDDALDAFASSRTYELLFDFSSRQWAEGPDNLRFVWEQERRNG